jgi:hypothetical protein
MVAIERVSGKREVCMPDARLDLIGENGLECKSESLRSVDTSQDSVSFGGSPRICLYRLAGSTDRSYRDDGRAEVLDNSR